MAASMKKTKLLQRCYGVTDMLLDEIAHLPQGYVWLHNSLKKKGRYSLRSIRRNWAHLLHTSFLPQDLLNAMVLACLHDDGTPSVQGKMLYNWLLEYVYGGKVKVLYQAWCEVKGKSNA